MAVLIQLKEAEMKLISVKCEFLKSLVEYLDHHIDKEEFHPLKSKVDVMVKAPNRKNIKLHSFIRFITYYNKILPNMATLLALLYESLKG